jgi:hypothetical protein
MDKIWAQNRFSTSRSSLVSRVHVSLIIEDMYKRSSPLLLGICKVVPVPGLKFYFLPRPGLKLFQAGPGQLL